MMKLFKSHEEKAKEEMDRVRKNWDKTSEAALGLKTVEEAIELEKTFHKSLIDAVNEEGLIADCYVINILFPELTPEQKTLILKYGRWIRTMDLKAIPFKK